MVQNVLIGSTSLNEWYIKVLLGPVCKKGKQFCNSNKYSYLKGMLGCFYDE